MGLGSPGGWGRKVLTPRASSELLFIKDKLLGAQASSPLSLPRGHCRGSNGHIRSSEQVWNL